LEKYGCGVSMPYVVIMLSLPGSWKEKRSSTSPVGSGGSTAVGLGVGGEDHVPWFEVPADWRCRPWSSMMVAGDVERRRQAHSYAFGTNMVWASVMRIGMSDSSECKRARKK
jgi:hypothetical protein